MPSINLPPAIRTSDPNSFARLTFQERLPKIIDSALAQNEYPASIRHNLLALKAGLNLAEPLAPLASSTPEYDLWNAHLSRLPNQGWLDLPFYFAEAFFYHRMLEAVQYFVSSAWQGVDPFQEAKEAQIQKDLHYVEDALKILPSQPVQTQCETLLQACLWGNQVDLSNFSGDFQDPFRRAAGQERFIIDHTGKLAHFLSSGVRSLAYILDNVGVELYYDLGLIDFLLAHGWVERVTIHLKNCPFFLSDVMPKDLLASVQLLKNSATLPAAQTGQRLEKSILSGQVQLNSDPLWTGSQTYLEAPAEIDRVLAGADLTIFKGDLNYRRLLGDTHWEPTTRLEDILDYMPMPAAVLRTSKSQIVAGLSEGQAGRLNEKDPQWLINGKFGIFQLISK